MNQLSYLDVAEQMINALRQQQDSIEKLTVAFNQERDINRQLLKRVEKLEADISNGNKVQPKRPLTEEEKKKAASMFQELLFNSPYSVLFHSL